MLERQPGVGALAEEDVLADRRVRREAIRVEELDGRLAFLAGEAVRHDAPRGQDPLGDLGVPGRVDGGAQAEREEVVFEAHEPHGLQGDRDESFPVPDVEGRQVEPILAGNVETGVLRHLLAGPPVPEPVEQVVQHRSSEQPRVARDEADRAPGHTRGDLGEVGPVQQDRSRVAAQLGQDERQRALAAAGRADQRDVLARSQGQLDVIEGWGGPVEQDGRLAELVGAGQGRQRLAGGVVPGELSPEPRRVEVRDDLLVLDPRVLLHLEEVDELAPRLVQLPVRLQERDQGSEVERVGMVDDEPPAREQEHELAELLQEVVDPLDQVLEVVDVQPRAEDPLELVAEPARLVGGRVVRVDLREPPHRFLDPVGQAAHHPDAVPGQRAHPSLEPPDEDHLDREEHHAHEGHPRVRVHHEPERAEQHGPVKRGGGERQPEVAAQILDLAQDHGDELPGRGALQVEQREPEDSVVQLAPQVSEHRLRDVPLEILLHVLERAVREHRPQESEAEPEQRVEVPLADGLVDDALLEIQHERVQPEPEGEADRDQQELEPEAPADDVAMEVPIHVRLG